MKTWIRRLLAVLITTAGLALFQSCSSPVFAVDNDDSTIPTCNITIGDTSIPVGVKTTVYPTSINDDGATFDIQACLGSNMSFANNCLASGDQQVIVAVNHTVFYWKEFELSKSGGCFSGQIFVPNGEAWDTSGVKVDIELNDSSNNACNAQAPLCRRVTAVFNRDMTGADKEQCENILSGLKSCSMVEIKTNPLVINQPVDIEINLDQWLGDGRCQEPLEQKIYQIWDPSKKNVQDGDLNYGTNTITFTPSMLGSCTDTACTGSNDYTVRVMTNTGFVNGTTFDPTDCSAHFGVGTAGEPCENPEICETDPNSETKFDLCEQIGKDNPAYNKCIRCVNGDDVAGTGVPDSSPEVPEGIWTAVGCIKNNPQTIVEVVIKIGLGVAGGVALLMILAAGFSLSTSQGDAKKTAEAKEMITSAVIGIIFIVMSITILEFIGVKIFHIPGFGE